MNTAQSTTLHTERSHCSDIARYSFLGQHGLYMTAPLADLAEGGHGKERKRKDTSPLSLSALLANLTAYVCTTLSINLIKLT